MIRIEQQKNFFNHLALELKKAWQNKQEINLTNKAFLYLRQNGIIPKNAKFKRHYKTQFQIVKYIFPTWNHDNFEGKEYKKKVILLKSIINQQKNKIKLLINTEEMNKNFEIILRNKVEKKSVELENICRNTKPVNEMANGKIQLGWYIRIQPGLFVFFKQSDNFFKKLTVLTLKFNRSILSIDTVDNVLNDIRITLSKQ